MAETHPAPASRAPVPLSGAYRAYALGLLAFINLLNYLDRNVIFALFEPIKRDLSLTDVQLGWLGSAYILVFSISALPFGVMSDLRSRRAVVAGGVALWSAFTMLSGLVRGFTHLFLCRAAVGIGEAAYGPAANSLVADYYPGRRRAFAMGILSSGVAVGGVLGIYLGGILEAKYGWRAAFLLVGVPGFICAVLAARLRDPSRILEHIPVRRYLQRMEIGLTHVGRMFIPLLVGSGLGAVTALVLDLFLGSDSQFDVAALSVGIGGGLAVNIYQWVRKFQLDEVDGIPFSDNIGEAFDEMFSAVRVVLRTPTLVYIFIGGALISFGMNGIVGWGPTFMSRELGLSPGEAAALLGKWGFIFGTAGILAGGLIADWLGRYTRRARIITVTAGFLIGGPFTVWLLLIRDISLFVPVSCAAFFFLSWYNGPLAAVIFDVVPMRISATVAGAYLLFIHLAGDAIAFPLIGKLSDLFGLAQAVLLLPLVGMVGGLVVLGGARTVVRDMERLGETVEMPAPQRAASGE